MGAPLWGAHGSRCLLHADEGAERRQKPATAGYCLSVATEEACIRQRRGWGGGGAREKRPCMSERETQRPFFSRATYPRAWPSLKCPPRGRRERAPAREGKDKAALADTALPSPAYRQEGAHVAAESTANTIVPPRGRRERAMRARVKTRAALAATALPDCPLAEGRTLLPRAWP